MRNALLTIILIFISQSAQATPTPDVLRALAYAGNVDGVEAAYVAIHAEQRAGGLSYDELRQRYLALIVYDPRVLGFTQDWLDAYPDSPHAHAIRAWQLYMAAFEIRGEKSRRDTYYLALEGFDALQAQALDHAAIAYEAAPDLVSASDAMLALQMTHRFLGPVEFAQVIGDIMAVTPNHHSLMLAADTAMPQWGGGGSATVRDLCDTFASFVTDVTAYDSDICFVEIIFSLDTYLRDSSAMAEANRLLEGSDHPYLDGARLFQGFAAMEDIIPPGSDAPQTYHRNPEFAARLAAILSRPGFTNTETAANYDSFYATPLGLPPMLPDIIEQEVAWAQSRLLADPYDPKAIAALTMPHFDAFGAPMPDILPVPERIALLKRRLLVNPYLPEVWDTLALLVQQQHMSPFDNPADVYYENAIVYSNYDVFAVQYYLQAKYEQINRRIRAEQFELSGRFMDQALFEDGYCPFIRLENLKQFLCNGPRSDAWVCGGWGPDPVRVLAEALQRSTAANLCVAERRANPEDLAFQPVEVDLRD
jgi:hypothetical protein